MVNSKKTKVPFNKGIAAFEASLLAVLVLVLMVHVHVPVFLVALCCGGYAYKTKMVPTYYKKSGFWGYAALIWLLAILALPYFFYDVLKNKAIKKGQDINTAKGVLFWGCTIFWVLLFALIFLGLILQFSAQ